MKAVVDRIVQYANRYQLTNASTGEVLGTFDFDEVTGTVQQVGTEIDAELFNSIANDLAARVVANGGDLKDTVVTFTDTGGTAANVASGDKTSTLWSKVKNWFSRLKPLAFKEKISDSDILDDALISQNKIQGLKSEYVASLSVVDDTISYNNKNGESLGSIAVKGRGLSELSWSEIATISESGNAASFFHIGQEKKVKMLSGEDVTFVIVGFNHDDLADGSGKAGITFSLKNGLSETRGMNGTATNEGGWRDSEMRAYMSTIKENLPLELRNVIKTVKKKTNIYGSSSVDASIETNDDLFLFSIVEIFGTYFQKISDIRQNTNDSVGGAFVGRKEGFQYEYYVGNLIFSNDTIWVTDNFSTVYSITEYFTVQNARKGITDSATKNFPWWTRSRPLNTNIKFAMVGAYGTIGSYQANSTGVASTVFGFCV